MDEIWHGPFYVVPFLYLGSWRRILFPDRARDVPFTIENYAYVDRFGRETVTWNRTFQLAKVRRFDATFIYSESRGGLRRLPGDAPAPGGRHHRHRRRAGGDAAPVGRDAALRGVRRGSDSPHS